MSVHLLKVGLLFVLYLSRHEGSGECSAQVHHRGSAHYPSTVEEDLDCCGGYLQVGSWLDHVTNMLYFLFTLSMEGSMANLPAIIALKKKYKVGLQLFVLLT